MKIDFIEGFQLSPQQKRLWLLQQDSAAYRAQLAILIEGTLNTDLLKQALQDLVKRHEILRTTFQRLPEMKTPIQVVGDRGSLLWQEADLTSWDEKEERIEELFAEEGRYPFDFENGPLLRLTLLTLSKHKYILLITLPSLCADSWTLKNIVRQISLLYAADLRKEEELIQYMQFSEWQNELLGSANTETEKEYWRKYDILNRSDVKLPNENKSEREELKPQLFSLKIHLDRVRKIETIVRKHETSISVFFLACWQVLLWRLTAQSDLIVGAACSGRFDEELEEVFGLLAKYLPIHSPLEEDCRFSKVLWQVNKSLHKAYEWQEYFAWEQAVGLTENVERLPFFPFCFDFDQQPTKCFASDVSFEIYKQYTCIEPFKVKLSCVKRKSDIIAEFHYDSSLFPVEEIERLSRQFNTLLESAVSNLEASVGELEILSDVERRQLLIEFNNTGRDYPKDKCIHQLIEQQAKRTPDNLAVVFENQRLTYRELNERANQVAHHLQALGVSPEVLVGICVERSLEMLVGMLGILKAGGAYVPLDPTCPKERLAYMLEDSQVPVLLTQQHLVERLPEHGAQVLCLDADWDAIAQKSDENPVSRAIADNLAYVIYTSGSTGQPKGVQITHQNLVHSTSDRILFYHEPVTSFLLTSPFAFDSSVAGIFWTLCQGGVLSLPPENLQLKFVQLIESIAQRHISHLLCLPSLYKLILEHAKPQQLASVRTVIVAGESCSRELVELHRQLLPHTSLFNEYGPTEGTVWSSVYDCQNHDLKSTIPIGRPIANTQIYLLDSHLQPVPIGVPGELHLSGLGLARGYLNRPELTTLKFIPNPFSNEPSARLYKTGDLARYLPDGNIEFLGRLDYQVKLRGYRIELTEIEAVLKQHPVVREAVVLAREDESGSKRLVAYVVPQEPAPTSSDLQSFLRQKLPEYMTPTAFVMLKALPLTPNGKVDRQSLPAPNQRRPDEKAFVTPRTPIEEALAEIWTQVLGLEQVGIHDNFFELGGDSLRSIQILSRANERGLSFSLQQLSQHPTIHELSQVVKTSVEPQAPTIAPINRERHRVQAPSAEELVIPEALKKEL